MLEIKGGGYPQIDLFNRLLINNIHRLQKTLADRSTCSEYGIELASGAKNSSGDIVNFSETMNNSRFLVDSFFPFTSNTGNSAELTDILITNGGLLVDGSIYDAASVNLQGVE